MHTHSPLLAALVVSAIALPAVAQGDRPPPVGDFAFVSPGRTLLESRFGVSLSTADLHDGIPTHVDALTGYAGFDWNLGLASVGEATGILLVVGMNLDAGATLGRQGGDLALDDFVLGVDASLGVGVRQDLGIETYLYGWLGYRAALQGQTTYLEDDLIARMWHLAHAHIGFRHELIAIEAGGGYGAGGGHFHAGARLWMFDDLWFGAEVATWIAPGERELWTGRAFFALRAEG